MAEYIERESLLEKAQNERIRLGYDIVSVRDIESMPAADVSPVRHGRWHKLSETKLTKTVECTHCHYTVRYNKANGVPFDKAPFCLSCGAKMDGGNDG